MDIRNPVYITPQQDTVDLEINHPTRGWIPITITQQDYPDLWAKVMLEGVRTDSELVQERIQLDLLSDRQNLSMSRPEFAIRLRRMGVVDQQWAVHAAQGNLPVTLHQAIVAGGHDIDMDDASILWAGMMRVYRTHPFVEAIRVHKNLTPIQMDDMFK